MLFIFDWDGTLCQSLDHIVESIQRAAVDVSLPPPTDERARSIIGLGLTEALDELFPGSNDALRAAIRDRYRHHFLEMDGALPAPLYEDAMETLEELRSRGFQLAVATGKNRLGLDRSLRNVGLLNYFDATRCVDETQSKPHPRMVLELMRELGCAPERALMVGDTDFDLRMANNAGIRAVGVTYGAHPLERLQACNPWLLTDKLRALLDHFE